MKPRFANDWTDGKNPTPKNLPRNKRPIETGGTRALQCDDSPTRPTAYPMGRCRYDFDLRLISIGSRYSEINPRSFGGAQTHRGSDHQYENPGDDILRTAIDRRPSPGGL